MPHSPLALWAGVEASITRTRHGVRKQVEEAGHAQRLPQDLARLAAWGVEALRVPVLWEAVHPQKKVWHWAFADAYIDALVGHGIRPIVTLVHHGAGPSAKGLTDADWPERLAEYAHAVATRYPHVQHYTPVNEPLTTARFSGLYGFWHPFKKTDRAFVACLVTQLKGTVRAMQAIRAGQAGAQLIQTEDLGKTHAGPRLHYQADFENHRRWLSIDLLAGRVDDAHPLWPYLQRAGFALEEAAFFKQNATPPNVLGWNYYPAGERFLDPDKAPYPHYQHGGNGRHRYADTEAIGVPGTGAPGLQGLLLVAHHRYHLPMALTEVHGNCAPELRAAWFQFVREECMQARTAGADVRAITPWAVFGSMDWNSLMTARHHHYEPGAFDVRGIAPRSTAEARLHTSPPFAALANSWAAAFRQAQKGQAGQAPVLQVRHGKTAFVPGTHSALRLGGPPLLIAGATGTLGQALAQACQSRGLPFVLTTRRQLDICSPAAVAKALATHRPWAVVNAAGYVRVDDAEHDPATCMAWNTHGPTLLARHCAEAGLPLVCFSSDLVFDGRKGSPYAPEDAPNPLNAYGESKARMERDVLHAHPEALVLRTAAFFGNDPHNFVAHCRSRLEAGIPFLAANDLVVSPTYVPDLAHATLDLLVDGTMGLHHLAGRDALSWADFALHIAHTFHLDAGLVRPLPHAQMGWAAARPLFAALQDELGLMGGMERLAHMVEHSAGVLG